MARQTDNLQLTLYAATDNPLVKEWRESLNLDNQDSALSKIDTFAGDITTRVQTLEDKPDAVRVSATSEDGINYTATVSGFGTPVEGATIHLSVNTPNIGATALSINSVSTGLHKSIGENPDEGLEANDLVPGRIYTAIYHDTYWVLIGSMFPSEYSKSTHNHDDKYAELGHNHDLEYSPLDHEHEEYADKVHGHNNYVTTDTNQSITGIKQFEAYPTLPTSAPSSTNPISLAYANGAYLGIAAKASDSNKLNGQSASYYVDTSTAQTVGGVKTFSSLPVLPTATPTTNNAIRKEYADNTYVGMAGNQTVDGEKTFSTLPKVPTTTPTSNDQVASKAYVDSVAAVIDHGALTGLEDNDHPQYLLTTAKAADSDKLNGQGSSYYQQNLLNAAIIDFGYNRASNGYNYINFHTIADKKDYDARIIASGGSSSNAQADMQYIAASHTFTGATNLPRTISIKLAGDDETLSSKTYYTAYLPPSILNGRVVNRIRAGVSSVGDGSTTVKVRAYDSTLSTQGDCATATIAASANVSDTPAISSTYKYIKQDTFVQIEVTVSGTTIPKGLQVNIEVL